MRLDRRRATRAAASLGLYLPAALALASCNGGLGGCPLSYLAGVAEHVATRIPLETQSDCAGASRTLNEQGLAGPAGAAGAICSPDPGDSACVACLGGRCCPLIDVACAVDGGATPPAACAADEEVRSCLLAALAGGCSAPCAGAP